MKIKPYTDWNRRSIHRLQPSIEWYSREEVGLMLRWGDPYGDPVWVIGFTVHPPSWYCRWSQARSEAKYQREKAPQ